MKKRNGLLAVLVILFCASISYGQQPYEKRINCGGVYVEDYNGEEFDADDGTGYTYTGQNKSVGGHGNFTLKSNPGKIFAKTRYTQNPTSMQYSFPAPDGNYHIILHWAEPWHGEDLSGSDTFKRQFDVQINGEPVEDNLCVYDKAGPNGIYMRLYEITATASSGIVIDFIDTGNNDPIISAIEVLGVAPPNIDVTSINLNFSSLSLEVGNTGQLTAEVLPINATTQNVTWSSDKPLIASVDSSTGLVSAHSLGNATITVAATDGSNVIEQAIVTVTNSTIFVNSVSLTPTSLSLKVGATGQFNPDISPINASNQTVTWIIDDTSIASVDSTTGLIIANVAGVTFITVTTDDGDETAQATITVTNANIPSTPAGDLWQTYDDIDAFLLTGNVGIGVTDPDAPLTVNGQIHAKEVLVDMAGALGADYVFLADYDLKTLDYVSKYIDENGHLPNIPSAKEMEENGIELKSMNIKLLEKIEELTLYILELKDENTDIIKKVNALSKR